LRADCYWPVLSAISRRAAALLERHESRDLRFVQHDIGNTSASEQAYTQCTSFEDRH
jgi:hypothetical protein